jgi:hypothetical protein
MENQSKLVTEHCIKGKCPRTKREGIGNDALRFFGITRNNGDPDPECLGGIVPPVGSILISENTGEVNLSSTNGIAFCPEAHDFSCGDGGVLVIEPKPEHNKTSLLHTTLSGLQKALSKIEKL